MLPEYLIDSVHFDEFLSSVHAGRFPRASWNHAAHLSACAATVFGSTPGNAMQSVRQLIHTYNAAQGIVSTPDYGYHETVTRFWVDRILELLPGLGRGATHFDAARAAVAAFAHRRDIWSAYYTFDVLKNREARAAYIPPDRAA